MTCVVYCTNTEFLRSFRFYVQRTDLDRFFLLYKNHIHIFSVNLSKIIFLFIVFSVKIFSSLSFYVPNKKKKKSMQNLQAIL